MAEWSWRTYPPPLGAGGVGSIPANPDALNVPSFRRRRFEMKLSPFLNFCGLLLLNPLIAALGWQVISNQRFCLRTRNLKRWEKPLCFRTGCIQASKSSLIFLVCTALHRHQFFSFHSSQFGGPTMVRAAVPPVIKCIQCFSFIPVWSTSSGMGGDPHSHKTVILLCFC